MPLLNSEVATSLLFWLFCLSVVSIVTSLESRPSVVPEHVHLSLSAIENEMTVMWYTKQSTRKTIVQFGLSSKRYSEIFDGYSEQLSYGEGFIHVAKMKGLRGNSIYYYRVGSEEDGW